MKKIKILFSMLTVFILSISPAYALDAENGWTKYESGSKNIELSKLQLFKENLASKVDNLNKSDLENTYRLKTIDDYDKNKDNTLTVTSEYFTFEKDAKTWAEKNKLKNGWYYTNHAIAPFDFSTIFSKLVYTDVTKANEKANELNEKYNSDLTVTKVRNEDGDTTEKTTYSKKFNTLNEAEEAKALLEEENEEYKVTAVINKSVEFDKTDTLNIDKTFNTKQEAEGYVKELKKTYDVVSSNILEKKENGFLNETYNAKEDAENALNNFKNEYTTVKNDKVEKVRDTSKDTVQTTKGEVEYISEAFANANKMTEEDNDEYNIKSSIRKETKQVSSTITIKSEQFDNEEDAQEYIDNLKKQGYNVNNLNITLLPFEKSIWKDDSGAEVDPGTADSKTFRYRHFDVTVLTSFTKIDNGSESTVNGTVTVDSVKIDNKNIKMSSRVTQDPNTGHPEYTSSERYSLNVTNKSLVEINGKVIYNDQNIPFTVKGYLSENQNVCGGSGVSKGYDLKFKSVKIINGKVVIDSNIVNQYIVEGVVTKTSNEDVWYVDTVKTTKGYSYKASAEGSKITGYNVKGTATKDIYKDVYSLDLTKTIKSYNYILTGTNTLYNATIAYEKGINVDWLIEKSKISNQAVEILPPQTGANDNNTIFLGLCLLLGLCALYRKFI